MAALLKNQLQLDTDLLEGGRGEFTVWVDDECVARKDANGFPDDEAILAAVRQALAPKA